MTKTRHAVFVEKLRSAIDRGGIPLNSVSHKEPCSEIQQLFEELFGWEDDLD